MGPNTLWISLCIFNLRLGVFRFGPDRTVFPYCRLAVFPPWAEVKCCRSAEVGARSATTRGKRRALHAGGDGVAVQPCTSAHKIKKPAGSTPHSSARALGEHPARKKRGRSPLAQRRPASLKE